MEEENQESRERLNELMNMPNNGSEGNSQVFRENSESIVVPAIQEQPSNRLSERAAVDDNSPLPKLE